MPRPRKAITAPNLNPGQAAYVLDRLVSERRVSTADINRYVDEMRREITDLESRLNRLREAHGESGGGASTGAGRPFGSGAGAPAGRRPGRPAGRPAGTAGRRPGRPAGAGAAAGAGGGAAEGGEGQNQNAGAAKGGAKRGGGLKAGAKRAAGRVRSAITPDQLASRQLQGRYLALVRQFPENRRAGFARTAKEKGREAAIKEMQDSLGNKK